MACHRAAVGPEIASDGPVAALGWGDARAVWPGRLGPVWLTLEGEGVS